MANREAPWDAVGRGSSDVLEDLEKRAEKFSPWLKHDKNSKNATRSSLKTSAKLNILLYSGFAEELAQVKTTGNSRQSR